MLVKKLRAEKNIVVHGIKGLTLSSVVLGAWAEHCGGQNMWWKSCLLHDEQESEIMAGRSQG